jgi:hypothetical protein
MLALELLHVANGTGLLRRGMILVFRSWVGCFSFASPLADALREGAAGGPLPLEVALAAVDGHH